MAYYTIIAGTTEPLEFRLLHKGVPEDLSTAVVSLLLADRTGTTVVNPGVVSVTDSLEGIVELVPTDDTVFVAANGPYSARWEIDDSGDISYNPKDGARDIWEIFEA